MKTIKTLQKLFRFSTYHAASVYTSCACYYIILSLVPAMMLSLAILSSLSISYEAVWTHFSNFIPTALSGFLQRTMLAVWRTSPISLFSLSGLLWIWSVSKGISAVTEGMDAVLRIQERTAFLHRRLTAIVHFILLSVCLLFTIAVYVFGTELLALITQWMPAVSHIAIAIFEHRTISTYITLSLLLTVIYKLHPQTSFPFGYCLLGAMQVSAAWLILSFLFSIYVDYFAAQYLLFGDLGTILLSMIWLRYCLFLLFFGIKYTSIRSQGHASLVSFIIGLYRRIHE